MLKYFLIAKMPNIIGIMTLFNEDSHILFFKVELKHVCLRKKTVLTL